MARLQSVLKQPEGVFFVVALVLGVILCFLIPPGAGFDETTHLARLWEISGGDLIPNQKLSTGPFFPLAFFEVSYRNRFFYTPLEPDYFQQNWNRVIDWDVFIDHQTRSVYFPLIYLPQAFVVGLLGRVIDAPVLLIYYLNRLLECLGYILLAFFAIRIIPFGKWVLGFLALAPMALFQAATISTDSYTTGISFLFVAWVLAMRFQEKPFTKKQIWLTVGLTALLFSAKPATIFLVILLILLPRQKFSSKRSWILLIGSVVVLFGILVVGWNIVAYSKFYGNVQGYSVSDQLGFILSHPVAFLKIFLNDFSVHGETYLKEWVGIYAYNVGRVPPAVYVVFSLALVVVWLLDVAPVSIDRITRFVLIGVFLFGYLFTVMLLYLSVNRTGSEFIEGVQGRYFTLVAPLFFLGLIPSRHLVSWFSKMGTVPAAIPMLASTLVILALYFGGLYFSFYVTCGISYYTPGLCYQPPYKNWDPNAQFSPPIAADTTLQQSFTAVCSPIRSVRIWSSSPEDGASSVTELIVRDVASNAVVISEELSNALAPDRQWLEVRFPPVDQAVGKQYAIELSSTETNGERALRFAITARREYTVGQFTINSKAMESDLVFQYGCER